VLHGPTTQEACCGGNSCGACCAYWSLGGFIPLATAIISCGFCVVPLTCGFLMHMGTRTAIRTKYNLPVGPALLGYHWRYLAHTTWSAICTHHTTVAQHG
jgi:hypothetical protein